jgi:hypothetical protein
MSENKRLGPKDDGSSSYAFGYADGIMAGSSSFGAEVFDRMIEMLRSDFETTDKTAATYFADWLETKKDEVLNGPKKI